MLIIIPDIDVGAIFFGALISGFVSSILIGFAVKYIDKKMKAAEEENKRKQEHHQRQSILEAEVRVAQGQVIFWVCELVLGESAGKTEKALEEARKTYSEADKRLKEHKSQIVAEYYH